MSKSEAGILPPSVRDILFAVRDDWPRVAFDGRAIEGEKAWRAFLKKAKGPARLAAWQAIGSALRDEDESERQLPSAPQSAVDMQIAVSGLGWPRVEIEGRILQGENAWKAVLAIADLNDRMEIWEALRKAPHA